MTVDGPLRVLAVISSPIDLEELDVEAEWSRLHESLASRIDAGLVVLDRLPAATLADLGDWLRTHQTHVIHFVGHGDFDARLREGVVYFQDNHGKSSPVTSSVLGPFVRDHEPLRMVVLNACRSARSDAVDPFAGMAQGLVQQDATAVVAMQFPISDRAAVTFTGEFYGSLVEGLPVDQAVSSARKALLAEYRDEWSTPVLFMRSPDGNIFENVHAEAGVVRAAPDPLGEGEERPPMPGPSIWKSVVLLVNRNRRLSLAVGIGVLAIVVAAVVLVVVQLAGDDTSGIADGRRQAPGSTPLPENQMLVAAGASLDDLQIYVVDIDDPGGTHSVSHSEFTEWLPVLSPDRETMVYSRAKFEDGDEFDLMAAAATTGDSSEPLFDGQLSECLAHAGRPAWSQPGEEKDQFLVLRCKDDPNARFALLKVSASGRVEKLEVTNPDTGRPFENFGDPTISPDGSMVVVFATNDDELQAGGLYAITTDGETHELLPAKANAREFSDAAFSPVMDGTRTRIAYRRTVGTAPTNFDVYTAVLDGPRLVGTPRPLANTLALEEDPTFSPDGSQVVFTATRTFDDGTRGNVLQIVPVDGGTPTDIVVPTTFPHVAKVPAWTTR
jgi:hypothetical protein